MQSKFSETFIAWLALISGLSISAVAVYYSVVGLTAIFAAAAIPIIIMGTTLEVSKLVATVWLKQNWTTAPKLIKSYLFIAIVVLMLVTSMGIFGFLSKAHLDQSVPTGDVADKISIIDEKIKTEKENIEAARRALKQMDESVDQTMARSSDETGANRAANLRRTQQKERAQLQSDIAKSQTQITKLNEERAPIAKELRKVEAEVGPIKYIAAFFYGDTDQTILEKAVTWVIITLIIVFDPLAVILLLASQYSFQKLRDIETSLTETKVEFDNVGLPKIPKESVPPMPPVQPPKEEPKPIELWNQLVEAAEKETKKTVPVPIKTVDWTKIPANQEYIVIDGQNMSVKSAKELYPQTPKVDAQISEQDYFTKAEKNIEEMVSNVRNGIIPFYKVPQEIQDQVKQRLQNANKDNTSNAS